ncbi:hypothetical protein [Alicyclobacillus sendaiensis]|uniref:hypothetical protein n=1 Tax=Alicyclobacillus sendaiensis TaxID=192387 RepID=UPI0026F470E7|nr:hypothetical protein [Alicyclobacillus sendaiensis]
MTDKNVATTFRIINHQNEWNIVLKVLKALDGLTYADAIRVLNEAQRELETRCTLKFGIDQSE